CRYRCRQSKVSELHALHLLPFRSPACRRAPGSHVRAGPVTALAPRALSAATVPAACRAEQDVTVPCCLRATAARAKSPEKPRPHWVSLAHSAPYGTNQGRLLSAAARPSPTLSLHVFSANTSMSAVSLYRANLLDYTGDPSAASYHTRYIEDG